jgi:hypothetical protein
MNKTKVINQIINKCTNCKYYQPNLTYNTLGLCLIKEVNKYYYNNHYSYSEITRSKYGECGKDGKLFKPKEFLT